MTAKRAIIWCAVSTGAQAEDERFSLPTQEADARALAAGKEWDVVDVLTVPGHSRRFKDFNALAEAASLKGIDAFYRLQEHWMRQDFDFLTCRDGDRFARSQALFARITEEVVETARARIWSLNDGLIDKNNYRMWIAMRGLQAAGDVDKLVKYRDQGMNERAARGLPVSAKMPLSHVLVRDEKGRALRVEVNEEKRRLWDDLAELMLEGIGWHRIEHELFVRYGHVDLTGREYGSGVMYSLITNPLFWGNTARHFRERSSVRSRKMGLWVFDESEPLPAGAVVWRNTVPSVYTGELAERVKAELRRRAYSIVGTARPGTTHRYTGLFVCGECGSSLITAVNISRRGNSAVPLGMRCNAAYKDVRGYRPCTQGKLLPNRDIQAYLDARLHELLDGTALEVFQDAPTADADPKKRVQVAQAELNDLEARIGRLIYEQSAAAEAAQDFYRKQVGDLTEQAEKLRSHLLHLKRKAASATQQDAIQMATIAEIREISLEAFWQQPDRTINQMLHRLFGKRQLVVLDKQIIGVAERTRNRYRTPGRSV